jgi:pyruvate/2-oxoglutarate dehydrogenase complex dihydrolipoamide acyltransferase (E2) component
MAAHRVAFPPERRLVLDTLHLGRARPMMHGLLEVDVTRARAALRAHRARTGEAVSFTAFVLSCLGPAVAAHPEVHALRDWRGRLVMFDEVDVTTIVETEVDGRAFPLAHVVRGTERRPARELHDELRAVQAQGLGAVPAATRLASRLALRAPAALRRAVLAAALRVPDLARRHTGTVLLSSIGMFGGGAAWGLSAAGLHGLSILVGGIGPRAAPDGGAPREVLCLTVSADHAIVDGAPLARFVRDLRERLEAAAGLDALAATGPA